jgi:type III pantothenate kinase
VIIPGFSLMQRSLSENTFALSKGDALFKPTLGNATEAAIANGSVLAAAGLVEKVIHDLEQTEGESFQLILTGGDALRLEQALDFSCVVDAELIFKGLQRYLETHR